MEFQDKEDRKNGLNGAGGIGGAGQTPILLKFAPFWKRMLAFGIDLLLIGILFVFILNFLYGRQFEAIGAQKTLELQLKMARVFLDASSFRISIASFVIQAAYFSLSWMARGQTFGARILKIVVITMDKKKLGFVTGLLRYSLIFLSSMAFYIPMLFVVNPVYHQRIHDALSNSVVVELPEVEGGKGDEKDLSKKEETD